MSDQATSDDTPPLPHHRSVLADIPDHLPALRRAQRITEAAATVGFDWPDAAEVLEKIDEELAELRQALGQGERDRIEDELGDLLFSLANLARKLDLHAEDALSRAIGKFQARFGAIEAALASQGRHPSEASLDEMDTLWDEVKAREAK